MAVKMIAPNGAVIEAHEDAVSALVSNGFKFADEPKKKAAPRKRAAKTKGA